MTTVSGKLFHTFTILLVKKYFLKSYFVLCVSNLYWFPLVIVDKFNVSTGDASLSYIMPVIIL